MTHNIDAIVFVFRDAEGRHKALYANDAKALIGRSDFEHVASIEPRIYIEAHYGDVERIEVLEREHQEFFERWHGERRRREALERAILQHQVDVRYATQGAALSLADDALYKAMKVGAGTTAPDGRNAISTHKLAPYTEDRR